ncbi:MAG TPA: SOS response-associated peptidase [Beutenbergiaceae bacterium]|nr:SOS response-associated peptidase [Beutenbergiaceae bacterium]
MCGRYASFRSAQDLADAFDVEQITDAAAQVAAGYNIAPTDPVRVVLERPAQSNPERLADNTGSADQRGGGKPAAGPHDDQRPAAEAHDDADPPDQNRGLVRGMHVARWGLIPHWAKDPGIGARMINARAETVAEKSSFSAPLAKRRCIVLADGYYEWHTEPAAGGGKPVKTPFYIRPTDGAPIAFAGLYSWWPDPAREPGDPDRWVLSTTIITQAARDGLEEIHEREPAVLDHAVVNAWLDRDAGARTALELLEHPSPPLSWYEVDRAVGSVRNQGPHLIDPV